MLGEYTFQNKVQLNVGRRKFVSAYKWFKEVKQKEFFTSNL